MNYEYLVLNKNSEVAKTYRDLNKSQNIKIGSIFKDNITWKDKF